MRTGWVAADEAEYKYRLLKVRPVAACPCLREIKKYRMKEVGYTRNEWTNELNDKWEATLISPRSSCWMSQESRGKISRCHAAADDHNDVEFQQNGQCLCVDKENMATRMIFKEFHNSFPLPFRFHSSLIVRQEFRNIEEIQLWGLFTLTLHFRRQFIAIILSAHQSARKTRVGRRRKREGIRKCCEAMECGSNNNSRCVVMYFINCGGWLVINDIMDDLVD